MGKDEPILEPKSRQDRRALFVALCLNIALAAGLMAAGVFGDSSGLIANALDNASDATVYAISYYAAKRGQYWKARAAQFSGAMLLLLCAGVVADVVRRFVSGAQPIGTIMIAMSLVAAVINLVCLRVLRALRHDDVNLRAAWTFSHQRFCVEYRGFSRRRYGRVARPQLAGSSCGTRNRRRGS